MKNTNTLTSLTVMIVREGGQLNGFLAVGLARREDASKLRAVELNMVKLLPYLFPTVTVQRMESWVLLLYRVAHAYLL